jgi:hypothetical protein
MTDSEDANDYLTTNVADPIALDRKINKLDE